MEVENWQKVKLGDVCPAIRGSVITKRDLIDGNIPVIAGGLEPAYYHGISNRIPPTITVAGSGANAGFVRWWNEPIFASDCSTLSSDNDYDLRYIYYFLKSEQEHIYSSQTGAAQPHIYPQHINDLSIPLPPLPTQRKIAEVLGALDDKIELNRQQNKTLEHLAQTLFKHHFLENPEAKEWKQARLSNVADFINGLAMQKYPKVDGKPILPVIKIREMQSGITKNTDIASADIPEKYIVHNGDLLFSWLGTLVVKFWNGEDGALNQHLFKVSSNDYPEWLYYFWLQYHLAEFKRIAKDKATTMGHIQRSHLDCAIVSVPPIDQMNKFTQEFQPLVEKLKDLANESQTLTTLRQTLLPRLISGELDVSNVEVSA